MSGATQNIETKIEELGQLTRDFMKKNDERLETDSKARKAELEEYQKKLNDRIDELETKMSRPPVIDPTVSAAEKVSAFEKKHAKAWADFVRYGHEASPELKAELKALATDSGPTGGFLVPNNVSMKIGELVVEFSPVRQLAAHETITEGDTWEEPVEKEGSTFATSTHGERGTVAETGTGDLIMKKIPTHIQFAEPRATQKMLDDSGMSVEAWISKKLGEQFGKKEGEWFISGTGVEQPEGILTNADVEIVTSGTSASFKVDDVLSLLAELPEFYAKRAALLMKRATKFDLRKLRDESGGAGTGQYLWQPSLQIGNPPTFDGVPVHEAIDLAAKASNAKVMILGDFKEGYKVVDRQGIVQLRDPLTAKPFVKFYTTRRIGGGVIKAEAMKILKCAA